MKHVIKTYLINNHKNKMSKKLQRASNDNGNEVSFMKKPVYFIWHDGNPPLVYSTKLDKKQWITDNITHKKYLQEVDFMLIDWELYEGGWVITSFDNTHLFNHLCQIGNEACNPPKQLEYFKKK